MKKHYLTPELKLMEFRLMDVVCVSKEDDEWETPIKKKKVDRLLSPAEELGDDLYLY